MHTQRDFIKGIIANPTDRIARLVFADWLDERENENDRAWATLIRAQLSSDHAPSVSVYGNLGHSWPSIDRLHEVAKKLRMDSSVIVRGVRAAAADWPIDDRADWYHRFWLQGGFVTGIGVDIGPFISMTQALFSSYPLTTVICLNRYHNPAVSACGFTFMPNHRWSEKSPPYCVPRTLWDEIQVERDCKEAESGAEYETWLRAGCVRYGRQTVGLLPLSMC